MFISFGKITIFENRAWSNNFYCKKKKKKNVDTKTKRLVYSLLQNKPDVIMVSTPDKLYGIAEEDKT